MTYLTIFIIVDLLTAQKTLVRRELASLNSAVQILQPNHSFFS